MWMKDSFIPDGCTQKTEEAMKAMRAFWFWSQSTLDLASRHSHCKFGLGFLSLSKQQLTEHYSFFFFFHNPVMSFACVTTFYNNPTYFVPVFYFFFNIVDNLLWIYSQSQNYPKFSLSLREGFIRAASVECLVGFQPLLPPCLSEVKYPPEIFFKHLGTVGENPNGRGVCRHCNYEPVAESELLVPYWAASREWLLCKPRQNWNADSSCCLSSTEEAILLHHTGATFMHKNPPAEINGS